MWRKTLVRVFRPILAMLDLNWLVFVSTDEQRQFCPVFFCSHQTHYLLSEDTISGFHFSSLVTIHCKKLFFFWHKSKTSKAVLRFSIYLSVSSRGTHFPTSRIFPWHVNVLKQLFESHLMPPHVVFAYHPHHRHLQLFCVFRSSF